MIRLHEEIEGLKKELDKESKRQRKNGRTDVANMLKEFQKDLSLEQSGWYIEESVKFDMFCVAICVLLYWQTFGNKED